MVQIFLRLLITATLVPAASPTGSELAARIASVEKKLPWLWSPSAEGLADVPYTYEQHLTRRVLARGGKEVPPAPGSGGLSGWRALRLERIPLEWGSFMRCLSQDGASPCSDEWVQELERQAKRRDALTQEERARIDASREERRRRRRTFWDAFPGAFRFESSGQNQLRFSPMPGYKPPQSAGMLAAISGRLWFDPDTCEVTRLEYILLRDTDEPFLRLQKGARFEIDLSKLADQHHVPVRILVRYKRGKSGEVEERTTEFSNYRRFKSESRLQFADPEDHPAPPFANRL